LGVADARCRSRLLRPSQITASEQAVIRPFNSRRSSFRIDGPDDRARPISCKVALFEFSARSIGKFLCENPCSLGKSARSRVNESHPLPQATANVYHVPASAINPNDAAGARPE